MKKNIILFLSTLIIIFVTSCAGREQYPIEPQLSFNSYKLIINEDSVVVKCVLAVDFTDGDGDIGSDTGDEDNFFVDYFEMQNGYLTQVPSPDTNEIYINFNSRLPVLTPSGANKNIKGTIYDTINFTGRISSFDTIMFAISLKDREENYSNVVESPLINLKVKK